MIFFIFCFRLALPYHVSVQWKIVFCVLYTVISEASIPYSKLQIPNRVIRKGIIIYSKRNNARRAETLL